MVRLQQEVTQKEVTVVGMIAARRYTERSYSGWYDCSKTLHRKTLQWLVRLQQEVTQKEVKVVGKIAARRYTERRYSGW